MLLQHRQNHFPHRLSDSSFFALLIRAALAGLRSYGKRSSILDTPVATVTQAQKEPKSSREIMAA